jgi:hypothetical protein
MHEKRSNLAYNVSKGCPMNDSTKVAVTVAEMARMCGLGRSRFYQLIGTAFPYPVYDVSSKRPFYTEDQQRICLEVRRRNCGIDGKPVLFYARSINRAPSTKPKKVSRVVPVVHAELLEGLTALGMNANSAQVNEAVSTLYPSGTSGVDSASILRAVFIHLKAKDRRP